jgi:hypothetical protein
MSVTGPGRSSASRRPLWIGGAVVLVIVLVVVLFLLLRGGNDSSRSASSSPSPSQSLSSRIASQKTANTQAPTAAPPLKHPPKPKRVSFGTQATSGRGVHVGVTKIENVKGEAHGVGEIAGPALRFTVQVKNTGNQPVDLDLAVVNAFYGPKNSPAEPLEGPGVVALPQSLKPGATATGRYVFAVPKDKRRHVRVDFRYRVDAPTVVFVGPAS